MVKRLKDIGFIDDEEDNKKSRKPRGPAPDEEDDELPRFNKKDFTGEIVAPEFDESRLHSTQLEFLTLVRIISDPELQAKLWPRYSEAHFASTLAKPIYSRLKTLQALGKDFPSISTLALDPALPKPTTAALATFVARAESGRLDEEIDIGSGVKVPISSSQDFETHVYDLLDAFRFTRLTMDKIVEVTNKVADENHFDPLGNQPMFEKFAAEILALRGKEAISDVITHYGFSTTADEDAHREHVVQKLFAEQRMRFKTGFKIFDDKAGGYQPGEVALLGANSGGGKSAMAISQMVNMARMGTSVAMLQLELTDVQVNERLSANLANLDSNLIRSGKLSDRQKKQITNAHTEFHDDLKMARSRFTVFAPSSATIQDCEFAFKAFKYNVWFIDYINLLKWDGKGGDRTGEDWTRLSDIVKEFKRLAKQYGIAIVLMVQINVDKESGEMSIRYAKAMQEHADIVQVWNLNKEAREDGMVWIRHLKARQYEMFDYAVRVVLEHGRFESIDTSLIPKMEEKKLGAKKKLRENIPDEAPVAPMFKKRETAALPQREVEPFSGEDISPSYAKNSKPPVVVDDRYKEFDDDDI